MFSVTERGFGQTLVLTALALFSLLALYFSLSAATELRISDNHEALVQARCAALSGLNHARDVLRGLNWDDVLEGPDGEHDQGASYIAFARTAAFRNPIGWALSRAVDVRDPGGALAGMSDDGVINTGRYSGAPGTVLIPAEGILFEAPNASGAGLLATARYFIKVADNSVEQSELLRDPADDPFTDGDGIVLVRSLGVAPTLREFTPGGARRNSVALYEGRYKRHIAFELQAALVVAGSDAAPGDGAMFEGTSFSIEGGSANAGISTLDTDAFDGTQPAVQIASQVSAAQKANIRGLGLSPSVQDASASAEADPDRKLLLQAAYLWNFAHGALPRFADAVYDGNQAWTAGPDGGLGTYDPLLPYNAPGQVPKVTLIRGDAFISGELSGGGILAVSGTLSLAGRFIFSGIVILIGAGDLRVQDDVRINGGILLAAVGMQAGATYWGVPRLSVRDRAALSFDGEAIRMAVRLIPPAQAGFREITSTIDP